jgi:hypothetical protein
MVQDLAEPAIEQMPPEALASAMTLLSGRRRMRILTQPSAGTARAPDGHGGTDINAANNGAGGDTPRSDSLDVQ